jgi:rubrerythrin
MKILTLLSSLEKVELEMASLYEWLSGVFGEDSEASGLFFRMAMQETSHANLIRYGKKLVHQAPNSFGEVDFDTSEIEPLLAAIRASRDQNPPPSLEEAVSMALKFEESPAERIHREILINSNPEVQQVIRSLAAADDEHLAELKDFAEKRRLSVG